MYNDECAADGTGWRLFMRGSQPTLTERLIAAGGVPRRDGEAYCLARAFVLAKHGRTDAARRQLEAIRDHRGTTGAAHPDIEYNLVDTHVCVYAGQALGEQTYNRMQQALRDAAPGDFIGQALALNMLCIQALHRGHFDRAQEYSESAIRLYRQGGAEFGSLHLHAHLGQIRLMRGDLEGADAQYADMEARLAALPDDTSALLAICHALRSEVAYEANHLTESHDFLARAMDSIEEEDAWLDVLAAAYRVRIRLAHASAGLPGALTELAHCESRAQTQQLTRLLRLMQVERVRLLTLNDELRAAQRVMRDIGLTPIRRDVDDDSDWAPRQGTIDVTLARWLTRARRAREALTFIEPAEDFAIRRGQLLALAKLRVIRAAAHWRLNQKVDATGSLLSALRLLGRQPFRRFILDEGSDLRAIVQAALDGTYAGARPGAEQKRRLSELNHYWATSRPLHLPGNDSATRTPDGMPAMRMRVHYLQLLAEGHSNKEIGRILGVSVNTVKYHLKFIFSELHVDSRLRAVRRAQELGIID
jgi:ATP/maltotriose-dependent transcriptional regulator MalT